MSEKARQPECKCQGACAKERPRLRVGSRQVRRQKDRQTEEQGRQPTRKDRREQKSQNQRATRTQ